MIATKMIVTAEAWTRVSRSGHWTFFSSAQQEAKKPKTPPRRFSGLSAWAFCGLLEGALVLLLALLLLALLARPALLAGLARLLRRRLGGGADVGAGGRRGLRLFGCAGLGLDRRRRHNRLRGHPGHGGPRLRRALALVLDGALAVVLGASARLDHGLGLGDLARDGGLGVVLRARLAVALRAVSPGLALALELRLAASLLGLSLCPRLRHLALAPGASGFPCAACAVRTSGSTSASLSGPAYCAATCSSRSSAACIPRRRASQQFARLRPCLL